MVSIAICDDEKFTCSYIEGEVVKFTEENNINVSVENFYNGEDICNFIESGNKIDILFLDIELGDINGVDVGKFIRETNKCNDTKIIYISSRESYAMQLFKIRPFDFLIKPISDENLNKVLKEVFRNTLVENKYFEYNNGKNYCRVNMNDILYFYSEGKKINIVTKEGNHEFYGKLKDIINEINDGSFIVIHKSYFIKYNAVIEFRYEEMKMINGEVLPISQGNRKGVRELLLKRRGRI